MVLRVSAWGRNETWGGLGKARKGWVCVGMGGRKECEVEEWGMGV